MAENRYLQIILDLKDNATGQLRGLQGQLKAMRPAFQTMAVGGGVAFGAISGAVGLAVKEFGNFEQAMSSVNAITGASANEFDQLTNKAKELGRTTAFTAQEAAEAMTFLGMAGFDTAEILETVDGTLSLAAASGIELGRAADIASNVLTGFRLETDETARVVDVLAKTITSSNTDMEQLSEAMKYFAPTAATFGVSVEEASAVVGLLGNAGLQGSISTRALATSMARLAKPSNEMLDVMGELNLEFFDANGEFVGMEKTIRQLETAFATLTPQQQASALTTLFGAQAVKQWNVLVAGGADELGNFTTQLENAGGAAEEMAQKKLDNLKGAFTLLKSAISGVGIELGGVFAPVVRSVAEAITPLATKLAEWIQAHPQLTAGILTVAGAVTGLVAVVGTLGLAFSMMSLSGIVLAAQVVAIGAAVTALGVAFWGTYQLTKVAIDLLGTIFAKLKADWDLATTGIALGLLDIKEGFWETAQAIATFFVDAVNIIIKALNTIQVSIPDWVPGIGGKSFGINLPLISAPNLVPPTLDQERAILSERARQESQIIVNVTENTFLDENSAEKVGDMIMDRLSLQTIIE